MTDCSNSVLILDAETRSALAAARSLGKRGIKVYCASANPRAIGFASRYVSSFVVSPDPVKGESSYFDWLRAAMEQIRPAVLLPCSDAALSLVVQIEDSLRYKTALPFLSRRAFDLISNKQRLLHLASDLGIETPQSVLIPPIDERTNAHEQRLEYATYPAVLKPLSSTCRVNGQIVKGSVCYPQDLSDATAFIDGLKLPEMASIPLLLQEKIDGEGRGVCLLCCHGKILTSFFYRRILEKPPTGGISVLCESILPEETVISELQKLVDSIEFHGAMMVEYKHTIRGQRYLIEINPRFWGSLQLAISSGRDFPWLVYSLGQCRSERDFQGLASYCKNLPSYSVGIRMRWLLGTLDHAIIRIKREGVKALKDIITNNSLELFGLKYPTVFDVWDVSDPKPQAFELLNWITSLPPSNR